MQRRDEQRDPQRRIERTPEEVGSRFPGSLAGNDFRNPVGDHVGGSPAVVLIVGAVAGGNAARYSEECSTSSSAPARPDTQPPQPEAEETRPRDAVVAHT